MSQDLPEEGCDFPLKVTFGPLLDVEVVSISDGGALGKLVTVELYILSQHKAFGDAKDVVVGRIIPLHADGIGIAIARELVLLVLIFEPDGLDFHTEEGGTVVQGDGLLPYVVEH